MSLFRRPGTGDDTSSSDESSDSAHTGQEETTGNSIGDSNNISRVNTINTGASRSGRATPLSARPGLSRNPSHVRDLLLHSLLEEKTLREAAEHLGKDQSDPSVQELARNTYQALSRQLPGSNDERYTSEQMRSHRAAIQEGIVTATRNQILALTGGGNDGASSALVTRDAPGRSLSALKLSNIFAPLPLQGFPGLHTDRYAREFIELQVVGKGGYGTVYKVKHKLDNSLYAVKRIVVSQARLQKIQTNGPQEMENMLEEVRALAKFDHGNIVRYHNCWLEFTTAPVLSPPTNVRSGMLLEHPSGTDGESGDLNFGLESMSLGDSFGNRATSNDADIVFEYSEAETGTAAEDSFMNENDLMPTMRKRSTSQASQVSQATVGTVSSARSHMSTIESVNGSDDDEIETIPRPHYPDPTTTDMSDSMLSNSDAPNQLVSSRTTGPVLTLNVQMSLYDTSLAEFLSSDQLPAAPNQLHHCFHLRTSLELLTNIISGVDYLHAHGVVHRDLKPANVFLAISTSKFPPSGSTDVSACRECPDRDRVYLTPRIGDFGLVAALGEGCFTADTTAKPVGTEFYRPEGGGSGKISEKLDVFALGVVCFEMLQRFSTRMERIHALTKLRRGEFPDDFVDRVGVEVQDLISSMVNPEEKKRPSCDEVQRQLRKIIEDLRSESLRFKERSEGRGFTQLNMEGVARDW